MKTLEKLIDSNDYLIVFRYIPTKQWISCNDKGTWYLSDDLDIGDATDCYEYVNEIIEDLKCKMEDIKIIEIIKLN
jgi:hypothetical protein